MAAGVSGGSTINNQLKASAATATETATMIATTTTIKTKATAAAASAWRQHGKQRGGIAAAAAALLQRGGSGGSTINNQLKALAATATETATMIATMTTKIKNEGDGGSLAAARWAARRDRGGAGSFITCLKQACELAPNDFFFGRPYTPSLGCPLNYFGQRSMCAHLCLCN